MFQGSVKEKMHRNKGKVRVMVGTSDGIVRTLYVASKPDSFSALEVQLSPAQRRRVAVWARLYPALRLL